MKNKLLYFSTLQVNGLFMMLTTLLPILIFDTTGSFSSIGQVLTTFMISLLIIRILCMKYMMRTTLLLLLGSIEFLVAFIILFLFHGISSIYFLGAILFGMAIAVLSPSIMTIMTNTSEGKEKKIGIYNALVAVSSAFSPIIGEKLFNLSISIICMFWIINAAVLVCISVYLYKKDESIEKNDIIKKFNFSIFLRFKNLFLILFLASISYGAIISYLPVYFDSLKLSIGIFYLFFWGFYVFAQVVGRYLNQRYSEKYMILSSLAGLCISQIMFNILTTTSGEIVNSIIYGFSYGLLYNILYNIMSKYENDYLRSNGFAVIGLMSYIGVGIAPVFLHPFIEHLETLFMFSAIYSIFALLYFMIKKSY